MKRFPFALLLFLACPLALFAGPASPPVLVFKSGFEGDTHLVPLAKSVIDGSAQKEKFAGSDRADGTDDWATRFESGNAFFSGYCINYEQGNPSQRLAEIVPDPADPAHGNHVVRFRITDHHISLNHGQVLKSRIQFECYNRNPPPPEGYPREYYQQCRLYFSPNFKVLEQVPPDQEIGWFVMQEYWNDPTYPRLHPDGTEYPFSDARTGVEVIRVGGKLRFGAKGRNPVMAVPAPDNNSWLVVNTDFAIPFGKWMTQEIYVKEGGSAGTANPGRFFLSVTVDGKKTILVDKIGMTTSEAPGYVPDGQTAFSTFKVYTEGKVADWFKAKNLPMDVYWDDLEIWQNRQP